jgi:hypothetical protein
VPRFANELHLMLRTEHKAWFSSWQQVKITLKQVRFFVFPKLSARKDEEHAMCWIAEGVLPHNLKSSHYRFQLVRTRKWWQFQRTYEASPLFKVLGYALRHFRAFNAAACATRLAC